MRDASRLFATMMSLTNENVRFLGDTQNYLYIPQLLNVSDHNSLSDLNLLKYPIIHDNNPGEIIATTRILLTQFFNHYLKNESFSSELIKALKNVILENK